MKFSTSLHAHFAISGKAAAEEICVIELFEHNRRAYESAVLMMNETGRAAVIHPTGTGKSFIGFKLCEDNADKNICWISPSEYIFKTQLENLTRVSGNGILENISFHTYAALMNMSEEKLCCIHPDYIILDEFHRAGAEQWGMGVSRLIQCFPNVPILGLTATNIRYLDNQRDMAQELFGGNIASEMTLGEAIARGILNAPRYVLSVYSYSKELEKYKRRIRRTKNRLVYDEAQKYFEALRRALDKSDGLCEVFDRHMTERTGKYIVFCSDKEHMDEMISHMEWFSSVDKQPHIYRVYSADVGAEKEFDDFRADNDKEHLKLLYCIDALNEGIHVDNISGVILLRPTVSPIVYKQQIGRALSASQKNGAVIFDIVLNIENLYSIGTIEEEVRIAAAYYRSIGLGEEIVNEQFKITDEMGDCRELFERLNDTLSASWELMYEKAKEYYEQYRNLRVPHRYKTKDSYSLGNWISTQRRVRAGEQYGTLDKEKIEKLNKIGMVWESFRDLSWERYYKAAAEYRKKYGSLDIPTDHKTEDGLYLGSWISRLRGYRKNDIQRAYLTSERIKALDILGMIWDVPDLLWQRSYAACVEFYNKNGHLDVPLKEVTSDGIRLGAWINGIRSAYNGDGKGRVLTEWQIEELNKLGMLWDKKCDRAWNKGFAYAEKYKEAHGDLNVPSTYKTEDGYKLGAWICDQREKKNMPMHRKEKLDSLGMIWKKPDAWQTRYELVKEYYIRHGNINVPAKYTADGIRLSKWLSEQRQIYIGNRAGKQLSEEQISKLDELGMVWHAARGRASTARKSNEINKKNNG